MARICATSGRRLDLGRRPVGDDLAAGHQDDPVGVGVGLLEVVSGEQHRLAAAGEGAHRLPELMRDSTSIATVGSSSTSRSGLLTMRDREAHSLGLAARQLVGAPIGDVCDSGQLSTSSTPSGAGYSERHHVDQLAHGEVADDRAGLQHRPDGTLGDRLIGRHPEDVNGAGVGLGEAEQHVDRGRLAGTVRAEQGDGLAGRYLDVDAAHGLHDARRAGERLDQPLQRDAGHRRHGHVELHPPTMPERGASPAVAVAGGRPWRRRAAKCAMVSDGIRSVVGSPGNGQADARAPRTPRRRRPRRVP